MKIIWLCNSLLPMVADKLEIKATKPESWITAIYEQLKGMDDFNIIYLFPYQDSSKQYRSDNFIFLSYKELAPGKFEKNQIQEFSDILENYKPDSIHIFGSEYAHSYAMAKACLAVGFEDRLILNIQGIVSVCKKHYFAYLPQKAIYSFTLRDLIRRNNIKLQARNFSKRGTYEAETFKIVRHVIGRTDFDRAFTENINPDVQYHFCNETLRPSFYNKLWDINKCERHSIFVSQSNYPIKGFHLMIEAMPDILKKYPDAHLYVTGESPFGLSLKRKIRQTFYNKYLGKIIKKLGLTQNVTFLGNLDETQMCERFLKSHVFVCSSSIENSPNSVGEAMMLGVPTVSSDVGGVKNLLEHGKDGFIYQADAPYMAAYYIKQIFADDSVAREISLNSHLHASSTHDTETNFSNLLEIYSEVEKCHNIKR